MDETKTTATIYVNRRGRPHKVVFDGYCRDTLTILDSAYKEIARLLKSAPADEYVECDTYEKNDCGELVTSSVRLVVALGKVGFSVERIPGTRRPLILWMPCEFRFYEVGGVMDSRFKVIEGGA